MSGSPSVGKQFALSAPGRRHVVSGESMKKEHKKAREAGRVDADEILPEYDFSHARPNKYASQYAAGSMVVVLEPDVAAVFPSAGEANEALRALAGIIQKHRPHRAVSRRSA
jgi:mRNA degradation ribonuclease J1/J2